MQELAAYNLIGAAPSFVACIRLIPRMAACEVTVLLQGETGTGKELAARAIHYLSARKAYPFLPVNCGAIPDDLVENELFGHVRGAFTDARDSEPGLVANAERGTLFLDEIECLSHRGQVALLRFLQDRTYRPLGGQRQMTGNVRILAASNANLLEMVNAGSFRQDLLYRLTLMTITLPALRERPGDVLLLANHFMHRFALEYGQPEKILSADTIHRLLQHSWPGNVRELENLIHRAFLMSEDGELKLELQLGTASRAESPAGQSLSELPLELGFRLAKAMVVAEFEKRFLARAMAQTGGNVSEAARITGKERRAFGKLLKKHGICVPLTQLAGNP